MVPDTRPRGTFGSRAAARSPPGPLGADASVGRQVAEESVLSPIRYGSRVSAKRSSRTLDESEPVTQYGSRWLLTEGRAFRCRPRFLAGEKDLSMLAGLLTAAEAARAVAGHWTPEADVVRHTSVGQLRAAGFRVTHSPTKRLGNHVSVEYPSEWDDDVDRRFDACFDLTTAEGGTDG